MSVGAGSGCELAVLDGAVGHDAHQVRRAGFGDGRRSRSHGACGVAGKQQPDGQRQPSAAVATVRIAMMQRRGKCITTVPSGVFAPFPPVIESRMYAAEQMHPIFCMHRSREDCRLCAWRRIARKRRPDAREVADGLRRFRQAIARRCGAARSQTRPNRLK